jgi:hypothetical protein
VRADETRTAMWLAQIAEKYVETVGNRRQHKILCDTFKVAPTYLPDLFDGARQRGLLTQTTQGRAGGTLTETAKILLLLPKIEGS